MSQNRPDRDPDRESPGPDPEVVPGLGPGGDVPPGETPPESATTSGLSHKERGPVRWVHLITLFALLIVVLAVAAFFVGYLFGLFRF